MSKIAVSPNGSGTGTYTLASPNNNASHTITLPVATGELLVNTSTGVDVTGTVTSDGLTVDGVASLSEDVSTETDIITLTGTSWGDDELLSLPFKRGSNTLAKMSVAADGGGTQGVISLHTRTGGTVYERLNIAGNGDISFYEDTGTTPKFVWDASAESLGIGTTTPARPLSVSRDATSSIVASFESANTQGAISFQGSATTSDTAVRIGAEGNELFVVAGGTEAMRISSTGVISGDGSGLTGVGPSTTTGAVGTYAWLGRNSGSSTLSAGSTYAGSGLRYAGAGQYSWAGGNTAYSTSRGGAPAGTWRAMGTCTSSYSTVSPSTIFVRIS